MYWSGDRVRGASGAVGAGGRGATRGCGTIVFFIVMKNLHPSLSRFTLNSIYLFLVLPILYIISVAELCGFL